MSASIEIMRYKDRTGQEFIRVRSEDGRSVKVKNVRLSAKYRSRA